MDSLHDCAGQSRFRAAAIFGGHFYLFACQLVQRSRKLSGEVKEVVDRNTHDSIPFLINFLFKLDLNAVLMAGCTGKIVPGKFLTDIRPTFLDGQIFCGD